MRYLPISLKIENTNIAVIGDGDAAINKLRLLVKTDANIKLFAPNPSVALITYLQATVIPNLEYMDIGFDEADLSKISVIFSCSDQQSESITNAQIAKTHNIPFNSPDNPDICSFFVPSIVNRAPLTIAISTEGAAPVLAKSIRAHLEQYLPQNTGKLAIFAQNIRPSVKERLSDMNDKRHFWENFFSGSISNLFLKGDVKSAEKLVEETLQNPPKQKGKLYIIHASDPDLLTLKAARILQLADHIYQIESKENSIAKFTDLSRRDAHFVTVSSNPDKPQDGELIMQIAKQARAEKTIVVIGDDSSKSRKSKIFRHLQNENIEIEHLYSAKPSSIFAESLDEFKKQYL